ncbi:amidohydrolase family protein [Streptomyces sp. NPDC001219]
MRTDVHAHLWSEGYLRLLESYGRREAVAHRGLGAGDSAQDLAARFALNDAAGIDHQILSVSPQGPYFADAGQAVTAARYANDHYAGLVRDHPARFAAFAALPLPLPHLDASLAELARALDELGMAGAGVTTDIFGRSLDDPAFTALFEEPDRLLLGTDFPYQNGPRLRRAVTFLTEALPPEQAERVLTAGAPLVRRREP